MTGLEAFGRAVLEDLWSEFERSGLLGDAGVEPAPGEEESWEVEAYFTERARDFRGRERPLDGLVRFALGEVGPGAGASAS